MFKSLLTKLRNNITDQGMIALSETITKYTLLSYLLIDISWYLLYYITLNNG